MDASCSVDGQDSTQALQVRWDWEGDGHWDTEWSAAKATVHRYATAGSKSITVETRDTGGLSAVSIRAVEVISAGLVLIQPGLFTMGSPRDETGHSEREGQHEVTIARAFLISDHEVTQAEWKLVMGHNPSAWKGDDLPVNMVSWWDCIDYCNARSRMEHLREAYVAGPGWWICDSTAAGYRLPTEEEWEYACRAGSTTAFCNGDITEPVGDVIDPNLTLVGWYWANSDEMIHPVKTKDPNAWGLYDMHGNVSEWCWDWLADRAAARGGYYGSEAYRARSADRRYRPPSYHYRDNGLRVVVSIP